MSIVREVGKAIGSLASYPVRSFNRYRVSTILGAVGGLVVGEVTGLLEYFPAGNMPADTTFFEILSVAFPSAGLGMYVGATFGGAALRTIGRGIRAFPPVRSLGRELMSGVEDGYEGRKRESQ